MLKANAQLPGPHMPMRCCCAGFMPWQPFQARVTLVVTCDNGQKKLPVLLVIKRKTCSPSPLLLIVSLFSDLFLFLFFEKSLSIIIILLLPRVSSNFICAYHFRVYVIFFATSREYLGILIDTIFVFYFFLIFPVKKNLHVLQN